MDKFVPKMTFVKSANPPWYKKNLKHLKNVRNKAYKRAKLSGHFDEYKSITDSFLQLQVKLFKAFIGRIQLRIR